MMRRTNWFDRTFPPIDDNGLLPGILERLAGTPSRLRVMISRAASRSGQPGWTTAQELGHLADLEPLWLRRVKDILAGSADLTAADLTNRATHQADHDHWPLLQLVNRFEAARNVLVAALRSVDDADLERTARHPRLGTPMRLIDLAYFVAEHDDHHIARLRTLLEDTRHVLETAPDASARVRTSFSKQGLMTTLGAALEHVSAGAVDIALRPTAEISQQHGFTHAGAVSAIADSAAGYAALSLTADGAGVLTTEFKINFVAPAAGDRIVARGRVVKAGRTLTVAQTEVFAESNGNEKLIALLSATIMTITDREGVIG